MKKILTTGCLAWLFMMFSGALAAQHTGGVSGKITDKRSGNALTGVTVLLSGTSQGSVSDGDGTYHLTDVQRGNYTVIFKYLGYRSKAITGVQVKPGGTVSLDVVMDEDVSQQLNEIVVTSSYRQESVNALYANRRRSATLSDGISADQIKRSPDNSTADVLQRISGTSVQDNKFVVVRGLSARYNATMMNGAVMPATEPDQKAFSFNVVPSNLIDNVIVNKTASPDLPGDAAGGSIQINTKDLPDRKLLSLSVGTGYNTLTTFKEFYVGSGRGKYDFLGFDDGSRALPEVFKAVRMKYASLDAADKIKLTRYFPNTFGGEDAGKSLLPLNMQLVTGNTYLLKNGHRLGITAVLNYNSKQTTLTASRDQYLLSKEQVYHYDDLEYGKHYHTGALLNAAYTFGNNKLSWKNFFSNEFDNVFTKRTGQVFDGTDNTTNVFSLNNETTQNGLLNSVLAGGHVLGDKAIYLDWDLAYGVSYRMQPDQRIITVMQSSLGDNYALHLSNENSPAIKNAGRVYSSLHEAIYSGNVHITIPFLYFNQQQKLKFGVSKVYRDRSFSTQALGYASDLDPYGGGATIVLNKNKNLSDIFSQENLEKYRLLLANIPQNTKDYTGTAAINAGYIMLDNYFSSRWRIAWGVRVEDYRQRLSSVNQPVQQYHHLDVLPSANLIWSVAAKTDIHLAYSRTLNRPEFRELAAFRYYDYQNDFIVSGNPGLKRSKNDNADFRIAHYPGAGEVLSVTLFYKYFHHPIEQVNQGNNVISYANADRALDYGAELELRKRLNFGEMPGWWKNLIVYANASFIRSRIMFQGQNLKSTLQGQSPYLINAGLSYATDDDAYFFSASYNRIGPKLTFRGENEGLDTYEKPRSVIDIQAGKKVFKGAGEIRLTVADILAQPVALYYKFGDNAGSHYNVHTDRIISSVYSGTTFSISFKYLFFH